MRFLSNFNKNYICALFASITIFGNALGKENFLPQAFRVDYDKEYNSSVGKKLKKSAGTLEYQFPGKIVMEQKTPSKAIFVSDSKKTWYYTAPFVDTEQGEVIIRPAKGVLITKILDLLQKGLNSNKLYKVEKKKKSYEVLFTENMKEELGGVEKLILTFNQGKDVFLNVKKMRLIFSDNKSPENYKFSKFDTGVQYGKSHFEFKIPDNTKVSEY